MNKPKTSLDKKHKDKINYFENNENSKEDILKNIESNNKELDKLNKIGKKATICLREPSLGPCFGIKGGAAGGGAVG